MSDKRSPIERFSTRIYGWLLSAYPRAHRRSYGKQMLETFGDLCRDTLRRRGASGLMMLWLRTLTDIGSNALLEHMAEGRTYMGNLWELLTRKLNAPPLLRERGKWVVFAFFAAAPASIIVLIETDEFQLDPPQHYLTLMTAIAFFLSMILLGIAGDQAPKVKQTLPQRIADKKQHKMILLEFLGSIGSLILFLGGCYLVTNMHPDKAQLLIGVLSSCTCACLFTALWVLLLPKLAPLPPAVEPAGQSA